MAVQARHPRGLAGISPASAGWAALVVLLSLATLAVFTGMQQFVAVPSPWPIDPRFSTFKDGGLEPAWEIEGSPASVRVEHGALHLRNDDPAATVGVRQVWRLAPGAPRTFRLAATVAAVEIGAARAGEVALVADRDIGRGPLRPIHQLAALGGTEPPARYVSRFRFPSDASTVELAIRLRQATGELVVKGLEVKAYRERRLFAAVRMGLRAAWVAALAMGAWLFWRGVDHRRTALTLVAAAAGGLGLLMMPESWRDATLSPFLRLVPGNVLGVDALAYAGHVAIFAIAGFLLRLSRRGEPWRRQVLLLVGLAGLSEILQYMTELRTPTLDDWLANAVGAMAGWLPAAAWLRLAQDGQFATQRRSSTTVPPQERKQAR
jgi:hypothetical protein